MNEIERVKKEADQLMMKKIEMYEEKMLKNYKEIEELKQKVKRISKENNDLYNKIRYLTDPAVALQKARESGL